MSPSPALPPAGAIGNLPPTQNYGQLPGKATINASQFDPTAALASTPPPRRTWPWIVGLLALLLIVIGGIVIAALVIPPLLRDSGNDNRAQPSPTRAELTPTPKPTPAASPSTDEDDVPDDEDVVASQLSKLEDEWTRANVKGDKQALEKILADEYVGGPSSHTKREYIDSLTPDDAIKSWELKDLTVEQDNDRATVHGTLTNETATGPQVYDFTDTFVWRDHRWQAVASKGSRVK
ncbi:MAG: hypothetical protein QOH42_1334 [Blastocatellia bacterium]|nr:hypothetical protein [Blastocatellia bacterium]